MGAHATRSASGNKRWMNCPGSIRLSEGRPNESSEAARLGTAAHGLGEYCLTKGLWPVDMLGGVVYLDGNEDAHVISPDPDADELDAVAFHQDCGHEAFEVDANMADAVQVYVAAVREELELRPDAELLVEHRSSLNELIGYDWDESLSHSEEHVTPNGMYIRDGVVYKRDGTKSAGPMFGTNDAAVFQVFEHLTIFDYKHGQGVVVEVAEYVPLDTGGSGTVALGLRGNTQLMQYALGVARNVEWAFETLDLVIVQPRARHADGGVRRYSTDKAELVQFQDELRAAAEAVERPDAPTRAGTWCQFCPAAGIPCPTLHAEAIRIAQIDFTDGEPQVAVVDEGTPDDMLQAALAAVPLLDVYVKAVRAEGMRRLRETPDGVGFGYKLVRGKANRKWGDEATVVEQLVARGYEREALYEEPKLKTPSKVEALRPAGLIAKLKEQGVKAPVGQLKVIVGEFAVKPEGKIVMAPADDPREAVSPAAAAASDFDVVEGED